MKQIKVDGKVWEVLRQERGHDGWFKMFARPLGSQLGPHSCFNVPQTTGAFRTSGHDFVFLEN